ncbi:unnamed protein product [Rotaria magnacalcarata]|uniref:RING-type domain-containing protein n=1 Tax=Rotaria magnacalcarata TaxID=392030 RepID=A0A819AWV6_9BILA|nr:unnamed protein product [Rotaria magnacalcarata]CAF3752721.1 unnamed protein product [Rotaria magnacalcarata]CAF3784163.1 unnamed protein product [Rotaria magnacalcarata]CAF3785713.1 unnamed protein product [Rotaria magnacalcarata]CAF3786674.1 unnamed protein product [Rotaria magnacalcarata]
MSSESENQNKSSPSVETTTTPSQEIIAIKCCTCESVIHDGETKLTCKNITCSKWTCTTCINVMLEIMFAQPVFNYPLPCGSCQYPFDPIEIDRILIRQENYEKFIACVLPLFWSKDCPFCPYLEIHTTDACPLYFFTCQHPSCGKRSCLICLHNIIDDSDESIHRSQCIELHSYKEMIEKAIEIGSQQHCPHCQLKGLKDDGCTHMSCERCGLTWCYLCGMKEEECLVDDQVEPSLSAHNQNWETHEGRCPMSLVSIHELDERWPQNDRDCLEYFHRYRTLCQLYNVFKVIGEDKFDELNDTFGIIDGSGYRIEEIRDYENRTLINYSSNDNN